MSQYTRAELEPVVESWMDEPVDRPKLLRLLNVLMQFRIDNGEWPTISDPPRLGTGRLIQHVWKCMDLYFTDPDTVVELVLDLEDQVPPRGIGDDPAPPQSIAIAQPAAALTMDNLLPTIQQLISSNLAIAHQLASQSVPAPMAPVQSAPVGTQSIRAPGANNHCPLRTPSTTSTNQPLDSTEARLQAVSSLPGGLIGQIAAYVDQYVMVPADGFPSLVDALAQISSSDRMSGGHVATVASKQTPFNGDSSAPSGPFKFWLHNVALQALNVPPPYQHLFWTNVFQQCLKGSAQAHYISIRLDKRNTVLYVLDKLARVFQVDRKAHSVAEWYRISAKSSDSVATLYSRLCCTFHYISEQIDDSQREKMIGDKLFLEIEGLVPTSCWYRWRDKWRDGEIELADAVSRLDIARKENSHRRAEQNKNLNTNWKPKSSMGRNAGWGNTPSAAAASQSAPGRSDGQKGGWDRQSRFDPTTHQGPWCTYFLHRAPMPHEPAKCYLNPDSPAYRLDRAERARDFLRQAGKNEHDAQKNMRIECGKLNLKVDEHIYSASGSDTEPSGNPSTKLTKNVSNPPPDSEPEPDNFETWFPSGYAAHKQMGCAMNQSSVRHTHCDRPLAKVDFMGCTLTGTLDSGCEEGIIIEEHLLEDIWKRAKCNAGMEKAKYRPYPDSGLGTAGEPIPGHHLALYKMHLLHTTPGGQQQSADIWAVVKRKPYFLRTSSPLLFGHEALYGTLKMNRTAISELQRLEANFTPRAMGESIRTCRSPTKGKMLTQSVVTSLPHHELAPITGIGKSHLSKPATLPRAKGSKVYGRPPRKKSATKFFHNSAKRVSPHAEFMLVNPGKSDGQLVTNPRGEPCMRRKHKARLSSSTQWNPG